MGILLPGEYLISLIALQTRLGEQQQPPFWVGIGMFSQPNGLAQPTEPLEPERCHWRSRIYRENCTCN